MKLMNICKNTVIATTIIVTTMINTQIINADTIENNNELIYKMQSRSNYIGIVNSCDYLNIRTGPSTKNPVLDKIYTDEKVTVLEANQNGWIKIQNSSGTQGWVNSKYISIQENLEVEQPQEDIRQKQIDELLSVASKQLGKPYKWGASGPNAFDCSGLTYYVYKNSVDISLPRTSKDQAKVGNSVSKNELQPGDLVFFNTSGKGISHVGMYVGDSKFIHSPSSGKPVKYDNINSTYYKNKFVTAKRII